MTSPPDEPGSFDLKFDVSQIADETLRTYLLAAQDFRITGRARQAEERYRKALEFAETTYGPQHIYVMQILLAITEYYEARGETEEVHKIGQRIASSALERQLLKNKESRAEKEEEVKKSVKGTLPTDIRKACQILGVPFDNLTPESVHKAWRAQMSMRTVHPDLGGDSESAVLVNKAKAQLDAWFESRAPKLGKKFEKKKDP